VFCENFTVDIRIEGLHSGFDLCGWEAKLTYDNTLITGVDSAEGSFLPSFEGPNGTYYVNLINDTAGVVHTAGIFLGNHTAPFGNGVVSTITFHANYSYSSPPLFPGDPGTFCWINLTDVKLADCASQPLNFTLTGNTKYNAPYTTLGWSLDCFTDDYRKKCITPYTGKLPQVNADAYEPQDLVIMYSYLTYNEWPAQDKIVSFTIYGPRNPYLNITIVRTAQTNESGYAMINFTIPHTCPDYPVEEVIFGKWMCFQKAQVKFGEPNDTLWFEVGWIVELIDGYVEPDPAYPCGTITITATFKNIMLIDKEVIFTFTVYDELLDPICFVTANTTATAGVWCNPTYGEVVAYCLHIPKWTHVGPGAVVYVNAFTDLPVNCGCPYCPELAIPFAISLP
jgi:hypothetical protein